MPFLLTIRERNHLWAGRAPITGTHASRAEADAALLEYVRRNWGAEVGTDQPEDPDQLIGEYFADVSEECHISEIPAASGVTQNRP